MSLKKKCILVTTILLVLLGLLCGTVFSLSTVRGKLAKAEYERYRAGRLADQLRQSSEDLTRMARTYAATGDAKYKAYFHHILAIRNGEAPRPKIYGGIFWDTVTATGILPSTEAKPISLRALLEGLNLTDAERANLEESEKQSNDLVHLEKTAFNAMKGRFKDSDGEFTARRAPDFELAKNVLHGAAYHTAKNKTMIPIGAFIVALDTRTDKEVVRLTQLGSYHNAGLIAISATIFLLMLLSCITLMRRLTPPIEELSRVSDQVRQGDPHIPSANLEGTDEISVLREAAERSDRRFFNAMDNTPDYVALYDADDRLIYQNEVALQHRMALYGRDFLGNTFEEFAHAAVQRGFVLEAAGREEDWLQERIQRHRNPHGVFRANGRGGPDTWHETREHRTPDGGTLVTTIEITESVAQEEQLRQAQKMEAIGHLTGGVAHDFNNVLSVILGNLELVLSKLEAGNEFAKFLIPAVEATERGAALTHRLLAFARKQTLEVRDIDIATLLAGMDDMLQRSLGEFIEIKVSNAPALWLCEIDPGQLEQTLLNLAINARDAMPGGGRLIIETSNTQLDESYAAEHVEVLPGEYVLLAVSDSGMTPEVQAQIFDPFFTTKEVGEGTGLELSMAFGFVKQSGGHISVYSEPGKGTTFKLYLPRSGAAVATPVATVAGDAALARPGETVLEVEDDADLRNLIKSMLENLGYMVLFASNGPEALKVLATAPRVDLLLTDVVLPVGMSGPALAKAAIGNRGELRVLFMSGYTRDAMMDHGRLDPGVKLLQKPFSIKDLGDKARAMLDG